MINFTQMMIDNFVLELKKSYQQTYSLVEPQYANILEWTGRLALENIANSDSLYHDVEHTILVATVGQLILKGKHLRDGGVVPRDWMNFMMALLCHDIGYVRGVCRLDRLGEGIYATGIGDETVTVSEDGTDAVLTPYHVDRSKMFVCERFGGNILDRAVDANLLASFIEMTRYPVPEDPAYHDTHSYGGLLRAADFIGQVGAPDYLRKIPALYYEFVETGADKVIGYQNPGHMRRTFTRFYWNIVIPYIGDGLKYLKVTQEGKQWVANLYSHVHRVEHGAA